MPPVLWLAHPFGPIGPMAIVAADLGEGTTAVIVAAHSGVHILDAQTGSDQRVTSLPATDVAVGDLDGDGDLDIAAAHYFDDAVHWYENTSSGWTSHATAGGLGPFEVAIDDPNQDGAPDIVAAMSRQDEVVAFAASTGEATVLHDDIDGPRSLPWLDPGLEAALADLPGEPLHYGFDGGPDLLIYRETGELIWLRDDKMKRDELAWREPQDLVTLPGIVDLDLGPRRSTRTWPDLFVATDHVSVLTHDDFEPRPLVGGPPALPEAERKRRCKAKGEPLDGPVLHHLTETHWYDRECRATPLPEGLTQPRAVDMDGDGDLDLVGPDGWFEQGGRPRPRKADIVDAPVRVRVDPREARLARLGPVGDEDPNTFCPTRFPPNSQVPRSRQGMFGKQMKVSSRWERLVRSPVGEPDQLRLFFTTETTHGGTDDLGHPMGGEGVVVERHSCDQLVFEGVEPVAFVCQDTIVRCTDRALVIVRDGGAGPDHTRDFALSIASPDRLVVLAEPAAEPVEGLVFRGAYDVAAELEHVFRGVKMQREKGLGEIVVGDVIE